MFFLGETWNFFERASYIYIYKDIETRLTKVWTAINRLSIIWKSDLTDKMKRSFFQTAVASILIYGCTTWTLTKQLEKKLDGNYTRRLRESWTSPGGNTPQDTNCTATCLLSRKKTCRTLLEKQGRTHKWCTLVDPHTWPCKSRMTSTNIHSATMWGYGMLSRRPAWGDER